MATTRHAAVRVAGITLALAATAGCSNSPPAPAACIDLATDSVRVEVRNPGPDVLKVPESRPDVGCCSRTGLTVAITDAAGRDLDRCGFANNFDLPRLVDLEPGDAIDYRLSASALSRAYCQVDLAKAYISVHDGARPLGTHPLVPCGEVQG